MVREEIRGGRKIYICSCGLGYDDILIAYACEDYFKTHGVNSEEITKKCVYNPLTDRLARKEPLRHK
ncbi:MAG TPA: hypothetical protein VK503_01625 [Candidatus Bathyarchaeia archaeon]|nr:hypothetical protein [Candidatus Bathyarchaeia archaeon]